MKYYIAVAFIALAAIARHYGDMALISSFAIMAFLTILIGSLTWNTENGVRSCDIEINMLDLMMIVIPGSLLFT